MSVVPMRRSESAAADVAVQEKPDAKTESHPSDGWDLPPTVNSKIIGVLLIVVILMGWSAQRTGLYKLPATVAQGVADASGAGSNTEVGKSLRTLATGLFPLNLENKTDLNSLPGLDRTKLPLFAYIKNEQLREYSVSENKWRVTGTHAFLIEPYGYLLQNMLLMLETIEIAVWGTLLALILALPLAYFGARGYAPNTATYLMARTICSWTRAVPPQIAALIWVIVFGIGIIPGVITLGISTMGFLGKFLAEGIENADRGPQEALRCTGAGKLKVLRYAVLPQVLPQYLGYLQYILEGNVKAATAIGVTGAGGIGMMLSGHLQMYDYGHFATSFAVMFVTLLSLEQIMQIVRKRLIK